MSCSPVSRRMATSQSLTLNFILEEKIWTIRNSGLRWVWQLLRMAGSVEPLAVGRVIGDVVDMFIPTAGLVVHYGSKQVANGCAIKPSATVDPPQVHIYSPRHSNLLFTLVMTDPDAPSPSEPTMREWLHWIVVDIPGGSDATKGKELISYMGPRPPTGIHRYVFTLFQQKASWEGSQPSDVRANFNTRKFSEQNGFGVPVAAVYFNAQKEPASKKR